MVCAWARFVMNYEVPLISRSCFGYGVACFSSKPRPWPSRQIHSEVGICEIAISVRAAGTSAAKSFRKASGLLAQSRRLPVRRCCWLAAGRVQTTGALPTSGRKATYTSALTEACGPSSVMSIRRNCVRPTRTDLLCQDAAHSAKSAEGRQRPLNDANRDAEECPLQAPP